MSNNNYYYKKKDEEIGPISFMELVELATKKQIKPKTLIRFGNDGEWEQAKKIDVLSDIFKLHKKKKKAKKKKGDMIDFNKVIENTQDLFRTNWKVIIGILLIMLLISKCGDIKKITSNVISSSSSCEFNDDEKKAIINKNLEMRFTNKGMQGGSVIIEIKNNSDKYAFKLRRIGFKAHYPYFKPKPDAAYLNKTIGCGQEVHETIPFTPGMIPDGIPYARLADTEIICK